MQRSPDERITRTIARDIAQREQLKALLAGSIASLGRNYVIALEARQRRDRRRHGARAGRGGRQGTGADVARRAPTSSLRAEARRVAGVDPEVRRAAAARDDPVARRAACLFAGARPRAAKSRASRRFRTCKRAIELDPNFAMAHALLSSVYANTGQSALAPEYAQQGVRAARPRQRARAVLHLVALLPRRGAGVGQGARPGAIVDGDLSARGVRVQQPRASPASASGSSSSRSTAFREAIRLDPQFIPPYANLAAALLALNRYDDARAVLQQAAERRLDFIGARRLSYLLAFVAGRRGDDGARADAVGRRRARPTAAFGWQAHASAFGGQDGRARAVPARHPDVAAGTIHRGGGAADAWKTPKSMRSSDSAATARSEVDRRARAEPRQLHARARQPRAGACAAPSRGDGADQRAGEAVSGRDADDAQWPLPITAAALALRARRAGAGRSSCSKPVRPYDHAPSAEFWPAYLRGQAYLQLTDAAAAAEFQEHRRPSGRGAGVGAVSRLRTSVSRAARDADERRGAGAEAYEDVL